MKKERFSLCTGDLVRFDADDVPSEEGAKGMITEVLPRRNHLTRPTVANMDLNVITTSLADPDLSFLILDKLLVLAARGNMPCLIVLTKADLVSPEAAEQVAAVYRDIGYEVFIVSSRTGQGIDALRERLQGLITVVGGPSGVGKSSLLNALEPGTVRLTGAVSRKIGRGRHTTRFTDLVPFNGGYLADSPWFGNVFLDAMEPAELPRYFREFAAYEDQCRFRPCSHTHEPVCGVKDAVAAEKIARSRYESYQTMLEELKAEQEKRYL